MIEAAFRFPTDGEPVSYEILKGGHINRTYLVTTDRKVRYVLQCINQYVFPNVDAVMNNVSAISHYLQEHSTDSMSMISYMDTKEGCNYYNDGDGGCWRMYKFVENSICPQLAESAEDFYESAIAFGRFQNALIDFPAEQLTETIEHFHDTADRYRQFKEAIDADSSGRLQNVAEEVAFFLSREEWGCKLNALRLSGKLPTRVTHNDTKINNVLLHEENRKALCVIDLDTVMPGLSVFDYGDAIRYGASTAAEDEPDASLVDIDLGLYRAFTKGFLEACPGLTEEEVSALPLGAYTMTLECGMRFLTDYINGDKYFAVERPNHNLDRARTQIKLVSCMEEHWDEMERIVKEEKDNI